MSRNSLVLEKSSFHGRSPVAATYPVSAEYLDVTRRVRKHSVMAIVAGPRACGGIAAEIAALGNRVVIVDGRALLSNPDAHIHEYHPDAVPNVYHWPSSADTTIEFFKIVEELPRPDDHWLDLLRRDFDVVLLDCPPVEAARGSAELASLADEAVLVVGGSRNTRQQIQRDLRALDSAGVKLAGCILSRPR